MTEVQKLFLTALREAIRRAGSQTALAREAGMQQSRISDYLSERYDFNNITMGTLHRIFPELQIAYFRSAAPGEANMEEALEKQVLKHFRSLSAAEKARYLMLVSANFAEPLKDETRD